jgi:hypothetical protein
VAAGQGHPPSRLVIAKNEATEPEPEDQRTWEERRRGRSCSENKLARGAMAQNSRPQLAFGVGEGETGRNRKTETHRETERNTEINTETEIETEAGRQRETQGLAEWLKW